MGVGSWLSKLFSRLAGQGAEEATKKAAKEAAEKAAREAAEKAARESAERAAREAAERAAAERASRETAERTANETAEQAGHETAGNTAKKPGFLDKNPTNRDLLKRTVMWSVVPPTAFFGVMAYDHHSGGALGEKVISGTINATRALVDSGVVDITNLEPAIDTMTYVAAVLNRPDKNAQNEFVKTAMGFSVGTPTSEIEASLTEEKIQAGKIAAVSWLMKPDNIMMLGIKNGARAAVVDRLTENKDEADKYLADNFINDLVSFSDVTALSNHPVTEDDIKAALVKALKEDRNLVNRLPDRLKNGLRQKWPDLSEEFDVLREAEASTEDVPTGPATESEQDPQTPASGRPDIRGRAGDIGNNLRENGEKIVRRPKEILDEINMMDQFKSFLEDLWGNNKGAVIGGVIGAGVGALTGGSVQGSIVNMVLLMAIGGVAGYIAEHLLSPQFKQAAQPAKESVQPLTLQQGLQLGMNPR